VHTAGKPSTSNASNADSLQQHIADILFLHQHIHYQIFSLCIAQQFAMASHPYRTLVPKSASAPPSASSPSPGDSTPHVPRQILSGEQWEELKPIIRRLYIDENKSFLKTASILQETHGFTPTFVIPYYFFSP
jgi:hypothetical protein